VAFSRPTPEPVFSEVGRLARLSRGRVQIFQVDERHVKADNDERNTRLVRRLLEPVLADNAYLPMRMDESLARAAKRYASDLEARCGSPPVLDLVHLGLGADGHTASLIGGDPVLEVRDRWVAATKQHGGYRRMTLTYPVLDAARLLVFVVTGAQKAGAVKRVLDGDPTTPAARIANENVLVLLDQEAASRL
jgi:6-phosphogluconolactonase/glucosamine-6-phosphate isomerase/deaminase